MIHVLGLVLFSGALGGFMAAKKLGVSLPSSQALVRAVQGLSLAKEPSTGGASQMPDSGTASDGKSLAVADVDVDRLTDEEKTQVLLAETDHHLRVSVGTSVMAAIGHVWFPPLALASVVPLAYGTQDMVEEAAASDRLKMVHLDVVGTVMGVTTGMFILSGILMVVYYGAKRMLLQTRNHSRKRVSDLFLTTEKNVWLLRDGVEIQVALETLQVGDCVVLHAGEPVPVDGRILDGMATIDQRMLTGEAEPAEKTIGDEVFAATLLISGRLVVETVRTGSDTIATHIAMALDKTDAYLTNMDTQWQQTAHRTVKPTLGIGGLALLAGGPMSMGIVLSSNFFEVARLSMPMGTLNFLRIASRGSILIKDGRVFDQLNQIDTVIFDKTGTLTMDQPQVACIHADVAFTERDVLNYAATAEFRQTHPIARAVLAAAAEAGIQPSAATHTTFLLGFGLMVEVEQQVIRIGSRRFMEHEGVFLAPWVTAVQESSSHVGHSLLYVAVDDGLAGVLELAPVVRPEAQDVVSALQARGLRVMILSGDHLDPVRRLAESLGVDEYHAQALPEDKAALIDRLHQEGRTVCFVGDGINDAIALKKAAVSISMPEGAEIARDSAEIVLMGRHLEQILDVLDLAREFKSQQKIGMLATMSPSVVAMSGVFLFGFGMPQIMVLYLGSVVGGVSVANWPLLREYMTEKMSRLSRDLPTISLKSPQE